jgi:hypothetical protein
MSEIVVVRLVDVAKPQPPQTFKPAVFVEWVEKQKALAKEVISCYEAGPTGFWLHRTWDSVPALCRLGREHGAIKASRQGRGVGVGEIVERDGVRH